MRITYRPEATPLPMFAEFVTGVNDESAQLVADMLHAASFDFYSITWETMLEGTDREYTLMMIRRPSRVPNSTHYVTYEIGLKNWVVYDPNTYGHEIVDMTREEFAQRYMPTTA